MTDAIFEFLAIFGCAAFTGVLLTIGMSFGKFWKSLGPEGVIDWFAANPKGAAQAVPVVLLPTLIGLGGALWINQNNQQAMRFWIGAAVSMAILLIFTVVYFFPINGKLENRTIAPGRVSATLDRWLKLHWIRVALAFLSTLLSFLAVSQ